MNCDIQINFFRQLLRDLNISSCIVSDPEKCIPKEIDLQLRRSLFDTDDYALFLSNDFALAKSKTIYCFTDEYSCKYIFLQLSAERTSPFLFIGPYLLQIPARQWLVQRGKLLGLSPEKQQWMELYYTGLPILEDENWLLSMVNTMASTIWNSCRQHTMEYVPYTIPDHHKPIPSASAARNINEPEIDLNILEQNYANEKLLMDAVSKGKLHLLINASTGYNGGAQSRLTDSLRNRKNYLIILKTLLRKAAEYGGVHPLHIHRLSSQYADKIENLRTIRQSLHLQEEMIRNYCLLVKHQSLNKYSYYVGQVITLVQYDLTADLRLKTIAGKLNVNASYLSDLFHREYGCTLTEFVTEERISHGIRLLQTTENHIQQIAAECGFQDTTYFIRLFKKHTGFSPSQYRENFHSTSSDFQSLHE